MVDHVTDTYTFTVEVVQHGDLNISNVEFPSPVEPGEEYIVGYDIINNGGSDTCFGFIGDVDNDNMEIAGTRWQQSIPSGGEQHFEATITGRPNNLHAKINVGYYTE